jgi:flagellar basal body L-ring protein FlgH
MNRLKRAATIAGVAAASTLATTLCLASAKYSTTRPITANDVVTITLRHNSSAPTFAQGRVFSTGASPIIQGVLNIGTGTANVVSVTGLNSSGNPVCSAQVTGPLPKDPATAICPGAVSYLTVVTSPE